MSRMNAAKRKDWKIEPMPPNHIRVSLDVYYDENEIERIRMGFIPRQMEEKWFIFWERRRLHFHRSWTGYCEYIVTFRRERAGYRMTEALINRDRSQNRETNDEMDLLLIPRLIGKYLLR